MKAIIWLFSAACLYTYSAIGSVETVVEFSTLENLLRNNSASVKAIHSEVEAAHIQYSRASRHWFPRAYLEARAMTTNDPLSSFLANLGQRQVESNDFSPTLLNHPGNQVFQQATLGIDMPLFEGGAKSSFENATKGWLESKQFEEKSTSKSEFGGLAAYYGKLISLRGEKMRFEKLEMKISQIISQYQVGSKSNLVGYAGLLGLKSLKNRIESLILKLSALESHHRSNIFALTHFSEKKWQPKSENVKEFISHTFEIGSSGSSMNDSVRALRSAATAAHDMANSERAKFLPKVGLFAQENLLHGSRGTGFQYVAGAYLQWEIFSARNFGAIQQAKFNAVAMDAKADALARKIESETESSRADVQAVTANLVLLEDSIQIFEEQSVTAQKLFQNGSINALQWVEVLSKQVDLTSQLAEVENEFIESTKQVFLNTGTNYESK